MGMKGNWNDCKKGGKRKYCGVDDTGESEGAVVSPCGFSTTPHNVITVLLSSGYGGEEKRESQS